MLEPFKDEPVGARSAQVVGITPSHVIVHDPLGEADLVNGTTISGTARFCRYSRANFGRRWMVEGEGSGWAVLVEG